MTTVYYARRILLDTGELLENGAIAVNGDTIMAVGPRSTIRRESTDRVVNLGDTLLLPGFINMHVHLEECVIRGIHPEGEESFASFDAKRINRVKSAAPEQVQNSIKLMARELLAEGTTTILDSSRFGLSAAALGDMPLRAFFMHEAVAEDGAQEEAIIELMESRIAQCPAQTTPGIGPHALYSLGGAAQKKLLDLAARNRWLWGAHMAESAEELQAFSERRGDLYFTITRRKPWPWGETSQGSMDIALKNNLIPGNAICFHCNYASPHEFSLLAVKRASIVHCFKYTELMGHKQFPLDVARNRKMQICLGTEGLAPLGGLSMLDELFAIKNACPHIPAREMLSWITQSAANALRMGDRLGSLTAGKKADILAVRFSHDPGEDLLEALIMSDVEMAMVMVDGGEIIVDY